VLEAGGRGDYGAAAGGEGGKEEDGFRLVAGEGLRVKGVWSSAGCVGHIGLSLFGRFARCCKNM